MSTQQTNDTTDPARQLGAMLHELDALAARYVATCAHMPEARRYAMQAMFLQAYHAAKQTADKMRLVYEGTV